MDNPVVHIYTDGSYSRQTKACGLGYYIECGKEKFKRVGGKILGTSHEMEMMAVLNALCFAEKNKFMDKKETVIIYSDSNSIVEHINTFKMINIVNQDLFRHQNSIWLKIAVFLQKYNIWGKWVKGHAHNKGNMIAHELANRGRQLAVKNTNFVLFDMDDIGEIDIVEEAHIDRIRKSIRHYNSEHPRENLEEKIKARVKSGKPLRTNNVVNINLDEKLVINLKVENNEMVVESGDDKANASFKESMHLLKKMFINSSAKTIVLNIEDPDLFKAFSFFQKAISNYQENITFIYEKDREMYRTISSGMKFLKNKKQDLYLKIA